MFKALSVLTDPNLCTGLLMSAVGLPVILTLGARKGALEMVEKGSKVLLLLAAVSRAYHSTALSELAIVDAAMLVPYAALVFSYETIIWIMMRSPMSLREIRPLASQGVGFMCSLIDEIKYVFAAQYITFLLVRLNKA